jgi:4-amino-4-deoxy-L-arabinose transferase-like glycosyltransferase
LYHSHVLIVIFVIIIMLLSRRRRRRRRRLIHCNIGILVTLNLHAPSLHMNFKAVSKH